MSEQWLTVLGFEGFYEVSDLGRVRGIGRMVRGRYGPRCHEARVLKPFPHRSPTGRLARLAVGLRSHGRQSSLSVHVLVLEAFVGLCPDGMECRHLDGNPANNTLSNLRWGTHKENDEDKRRHGHILRGERVSNAVLTEEQVRAIKRMDRSKSNRAVAAELGVAFENVKHVRLGHAWAWVEP